jgi:hypothetical protein
MGVNGRAGWLEWGGCTIMICANAEMPRYELVAVDLSTTELLRAAEARLKQHEHDDLELHELAGASALYPFGAPRFATSAFLEPSL